MCMLQDRPHGQKGFPRVPCPFRFGLLPFLLVVLAPALAWAADTRATMQVGATVIRPASIEYQTDDVGIALLRISDADLANVTFGLTGAGTGTLAGSSSGADQPVFLTIEY